MKNFNYGSCKQVKNSQEKDRVENTYGQKEVASKEPDSQPLLSQATKAATVSTSSPHPSSTTEHKNH
jgi:hypothetical protein